MQDNSFLEDCILMIERKLNWGPSVHWTAYHFSKLSDDILAKTGKTVSDSTLKRLFGKKDTSENYTPQLYTRNAIAQYLGFQDWQDFQNKRKSDLPPAKAKRTHFSNGTVLIFTLVSASIILVFLFLKRTREDSGWLKTNDTTNLVPYTVVFSYDVSNVKDSVFIDFGNNVPVLLPKNKKSISEFYKASGIFYPKIFTRKKVLDSVSIRNYSHHWQSGYSTNDDFRSFIPLEDTSRFWQADRLFLPVENLDARNPLYKDGFYTEYRLVKDFNVSLDSVEVSTTVKNTPAEGGKLCYDVEIWLLGTRNNCRVRFVEPGCFRYGQLKISENEYSGRFDNLSALARDLKTWRVIGIKISDSSAYFSFDGKPVMKENYKESMGKLIGIYVRFYGTGSVKNVIINQTQRELYF